MGEIVIVLDEVTKAAMPAVAKGAGDDLETVEKVWAEMFRYLALSFGPEAFGPTAYEMQPGADITLAEERAKHADLLAEGASAQRYICRVTEIMPSRVMRILAEIAGHYSQIGALKDPRAYLDLLNRADDLSLDEQEKDDAEPVN